MSIRFHDRLFGQRKRFELLEGAPVREFGGNGTAGDATSLSVQRSLLCRIEFHMIIRIYYSWGRFIGAPQG